MADTGPLLGALLELEIGAVAQGGACVARHEGRVVFVRHTLPGERVRARVIEDRGGSFCRADAVEILEPAEGRVRPPCPHAGPGRCGGCDWQHATASAQRELKAVVVREQFARLAGTDLGATFAGVEELPGGLLGWRTRVLYAVGHDGRRGLHRHHSHDIEPVDQCLLGAPGVAAIPALQVDGPGLTGLEPAIGSDPQATEVTVLAHRPGAGRQARGRRPPDRVQVVAGPARLRHRAAGRDFEVDAAGFWQVHPAALDTFTAALLDAVRPQTGETVLDLYAGAGALTAALGGAVGPIGRVVGVESARTAVADAAANLADLPHAEVRQGRVTPESVADSDVRADVVVLDPPRAGCGPEVMAAILARRPRIVGYLSCDPSTLARDVAAALAHGWRLASLRAFDAFPMTHHVECIATLVPGDGTGRALPSAP